MNRQWPAVWIRLGLLLPASPLGCSQSDDTPAMASGRDSGTGGASASLDGSTVTDGASDAGGSAPTELESNAWNWVPVEGLHCRDGSNTGVGVNANPASDKLVILLDQGGACFDSTTCGMNLSHYGVTQLDTFAADVQTGGGAGVFDRSPFAERVNAR